MMKTLSRSRLRFVSAENSNCRRKTREKSIPTI